MPAGGERVGLVHEIETNLAADGLLDLGEEVLVLFDELGERDW